MVYSDICRTMHEILLKSLVLEVLKVSEKAASLVCIVRSEESLFELLVQEKKGDQSNKRFVHDFKTLADVLVQETVRHDLGEKVKSETSSFFTVAPTLIDPSSILSSRVSTTPGNPGNLLEFVWSSWKFCIKCR